MSEFRGADLKQAVLKAEHALGRSKEELEIEVLDSGRRGLFGLFARPARISARVLAVVESAAPQPRTVQGEVEPNSVAAPVEEAVPKESAVGAPDLQAELSPEEITARHEHNLYRMSAAAVKLIDYLTTAYRALRIDVSARVAKSTAREVEIELNAKTPGQVIGYHGRRINAFEVLSAAFLSYQGVKDAQVTLDIENYRAKREEAITRLGERAVIDVIASGQAVFLDPMPARERKLLHKQLEENRNVRTYSQGREPFRSIVIAPK
ncbi:MAG: RNA-binding cell elongation regulator Jag/EloR [Limosilactobacillus gorillae]|uniref:RNA-binding cell elongation regulator Jag/EloR n=1 Tax=Limosilactobacillus gorillae TaxID=1450649 RepID=UPI000AEF3991|nr:RNA-binding cell elongation regulator Jag/EloR [Limosilactobacillus gorillae]MDO4855586.1 RNA-binding cell elongation regulator Jag/EloR [Limosilactobacillus gorillae]